MSKHQTINEATWCFYEMPGSLSSDELTKYSSYYKKHYGNYSHRKGNRFFFQFNSTADRDAFLDTLEVSARATLVVERIRIQVY